MEDWRKCIEGWENENQAFILFANPGSETIYLLHNLVEVETKEDSKFVYAPFSEKQKSFYFSGDLKSFQLKRHSELELALPVTFLAVNPLYAKAFREALQELKSENIQKVVLSRIHTESASQKSFLPLVLELLEFYPMHAVHWLVHPEIGEWLGASPELLLEQFPNLNLKTMSLAGTQPVSEEWTEKEKEEQQIVTDYIKNIWTKENVKNIEISNVYDLKSGPIKHLKTDFKGEYAGPLNKLLREMHPTPAVAGLPLNKSVEAIERIESHKREFYAGYFGWKQNGHSRYYVNLRCLNRQNGEVHFFVGGGLTSKSDLEREWIETEEKRATLYHFWRRNEN